MTASPTLTRLVAALDGLEPAAQDETAAEWDAAIAETVLADWPTARLEALSYE